MYPPKAEDEDVIRLIHELSVNGKPPSGVVLRRALAKRYGTRGGVSRIYRLLQQHTAKISPNGTGLIEQKLLEQKVRNLQHLLDAAAKTADASQTYWKAKVDELRQRIDELERGVREAVAVGITQDSVQEKIKALAVEGGRLEVLLRAFGPETMKGKLIELVREVMR